MVQLGDLDISESHPLASELSSLRAAVAQFQDEAHSSSIKLQRHALDTTNANHRLVQLEHENSVLKSEISVLRAHPQSDVSSQAHPAVTQVQQLTLSLRRLSDKLSLTEEALLARTTELAHATGEASKARLAAESAYQLAARTRGREEAGKVRETELEWKVKAAEEAVKMSDLAVNEYADLVRSLEAKAGMRMHVHSHSNSSSSLRDISAVESTPAIAVPVKLADSLVEGKMGLQRLLSEFSTATEKLQAELVHLHGELATSEAKGEAERKSAELARDELAMAQFELQKLKLDDNAAAKMVSRYMQFSQKSTNNLQDALNTLQIRHAGTIETLSAQLTTASSLLESSERRAERLRHALDELGGDILKETYGRRREVALRIRMINREENIREELERWIRRADEFFLRDPDGGRVVHERMLKDARALLSSTFDGPPTSSPSSGSLARIIAAQNAVDFLSDELQRETARRLELERFVARAAVHDGPVATNSLLPAFPPSSRGSMSQAINGSLGLRNGVVDTNTSSPQGLSLSIAEDLSAETSDLSHGRSTLDVLPPRSADQNEIQSSLGSSSTTSLVVQKDDQDAGPEIPVIYVASDDTSQSFLPIPMNADGVTPDPLVSKAPSLSGTNRQSESSPEVGPASDLVLRPVNIDTTAESRASPELEASHPTANSDVDHRSHAVADAALSELTEGRSSPSLSSNTTIDKNAEPPVSSESDASRPTANGGFDHRSSAIAEAPPSYLAEEPSSPVFSSNLPKSGVEPLEPSSPLDTEAISFIPPSHIPPPLPITDTESATSLLVHSDLSQEVPKHSLLADLLQVRHRYDGLQRAFRDCHLALEALKTSMSSAFPDPNTSAVRAGNVSPGVLRTALDRLNHYTEDARVELEIRIADEALMAGGFEALLSVPGALSSPSSTSLSQSHTHDDHETSFSQSEVEKQIEEFISGTDLSVQKSQQSLSRKLDDIQHDIASIKLAVHDILLAPPTPSTAPGSNGGGGGWTSWIRSSPSVPSTPGSAPGPSLGPGQAPTFGDVMTSPRLRHSPSLNFQVQSKKNPFASLGLRVPMPSYVLQGISQAPQRSRTVSTMYMLGLGANRPSVNGSLVPTAQRARNLMSRADADTETEMESTGTVEDDGDVE